MVQTAWFWFRNIKMTIQAFYIFCVNILKFNIPKNVLKLCMLILNSIICKMCSSRKYCIRASTQRVGLCLNHFPPQMYNIKASRSCSQWKWETRIASSNQRVSYLLFTLIYSSGSFQRSTMQIAISVKKDCLEPEINLSSMATWHHIFPLYEVWKILLKTDFVISL